MSPLDYVETALYTQKHKDARQFRSMMQGPHIILRLLGSTNGGSVQGRIVRILKKVQRDMSLFDTFETALYTQEHKDARPFRSMMQGPHIFYDC